MDIEHLILKVTSLLSSSTCPVLLPNLGFWSFDKFESKQGTFTNYSVGNMDMVRFN